jgi:cysteine desulfurase
MLPWLGPASNPSSLHGPGRRARDAVDLARAAVAEALGVEFGSVVFYSSGSEAAAGLVLGIALAAGRPGRVLASAAEHECVLAHGPDLARLGVRLETFGVDRHGRGDLDDLETRLADDVLAVFLMDGQNEVGSRNDIATAGQLCARWEVPLVVDAVQTFPGCRAAIQAGAAAVFGSSHKHGGPQGAAPAYVRPGLALEPVVRGGGQERGRRAGTENVAAIAGAGAAVQVPRPSDPAPARALLHHLVEHAGFVATDPGPGALPGHVHGRFPGVHAESLLVRLDQAGVQASAGSACSSGSLEPSHVLTAMGWPAEHAAEAVRFSLGPGQGPTLAEEAARRVAAQVRAIRDLADQRR